MDIDPTLITDIAIKNKITGLVQHFSAKDHEFTFSIDRKPTLNKDLMLLVFENLPLKEQVQFTKIDTRQFSSCSIKKLHEVGHGIITKRLIQEDLERINPINQKLYWFDLQILNLDGAVTDVRMLPNLKIVIVSFMTSDQIKMGKDVKDVYLE